jgi:hypothetical protein
VAGGREGDRLRARPPDSPAARSSGPATPTAPRGTFALLTGSSSICHSLRCAIALADELGHERPDWELSAAQLADVIRHHEPDAFAPKHRWAMDWYYPVLGGVMLGETGRARLADRFDTFIDDGRGVRCVKDRPWITVAETCECMIAHLAVGERETAERLFSWAQQYRVESGRYWTGTVYPDLSHFPADEQSTYTAAAVVLAADALDGHRPGLGPVHRPRRRAAAAARHPPPPASGPTTAAGARPNCWG